jgi:hypothetical protein
MSDYPFRRGQHVTVEDDGQTFEATIVRQAEPRDGVDPDAVPGGDVTSVVWVRRAGIDEIVGYLKSDICPKPEVDVRIAIGRAYEEMHDERRDATTAFADEIHESLGVTVDLEVTERQPGRVGLGPIEWTAIFIGTTVATTLITNLTNDLYEQAKRLLRQRKANGRKRSMGFVIYGPDGKELRRWSTNEDEAEAAADHDSGDASDDQE